MGINVECYAGHAYPTEPRAFTVRGFRHVIEEVERTWRTPDALWFRVRTHRDAIYTLAYYEDEDAWVVLPLSNLEEDQR